MTVDTEKYLDFVAGVTSPASSDYAELLRRLSELEIEGYKKMEEELMDHHMLTFSDLHKLGIRELYQKYRIERSLM